MASNEQTVTLLRANKRAQVEALNSLGFNLTEPVRAADFPMYVKWAAGLLDVTIAANRRRDNKKFFFTLDEWQSLSYAEQELFLLRGVRVRARGLSFVIAPDDITGKAWGGKVQVPDTYNYSAKRDLYKYSDALTETRLIAEYYAGKTIDGIAGAPAAEAALAYKAFTMERDGVEDVTEWCLPTQAHNSIMIGFRYEIEEVFTAVWSASFKFMNDHYWSCNQYDATSVPYVNFASCQMVNGTKAEVRNVRPISVE